MTEEQAFSGHVRILTKSYGLLNDDNNNGELDIQVDTLTSTETRTMLLRDTKFITAGNETFLVGIPVAPYQGTLFDWGLDNNLIEDEDYSFRIWFPMHEVISMIPSPQQ